MSIDAWGVKYIAQWGKSCVTYRGVKKKLAVVLTPNEQTASSYAYKGSCHPPALFEGCMTSNQTLIAGKGQEVAPKTLCGLISSSTTSILLASTPPMLARWYLTNHSGRALLMDCQRLNPTSQVKSSWVQPTSRRSE